jgi:hypothetical protein
MELGIPLLAMGGLYIISNQSKKGSENFENKSKLPNVDVPNKNYPEYPVISAETDLTSKLSTVNKFDSPNVYTDKYFNPNMNKSVVDSYANLQDSTNGTPTQYYSMTGEKVDQNYFRHNNMVPYFGGNVRTRHVDANAAESVLDNYLGAGSQHFSKKEQAPLFAPGENYQWANGAPNTTDFMRSRVNPSSRMANVKPFEEERVAPGLGLGYTTQGSDGFNSGMMNRDAWTEKNVDQLRVATNPKSSGHALLGYEGPAIHKTTNRGFVGTVEKNRPDKTFEMGQDRLFTTTGLEKGQTIRSMPVDRYEPNRVGTTSDYAGIAGVGHSSTYIDGEHMPSHRIELGAVQFTAAGANGKGIVTESDYGMKSKMAYPNNRSSNKQDSYFGAIGGAFGTAVAPLLDALRPSRKENTIGNLRPYQNAKSAVSSSYLYDPKDVPLPTIRETTEASLFHMNVNANQNGGAYSITAHQPIENARLSTTDYYYAGNASAGDRSREMRSYEAEYNQRNNDIKSSTIDGRMVPGNMRLFNSDVNMAAKHKDAYLINNRPLAPEGTKNAPSIQTMGRVAGNEPLYQNIQMDRNAPDVLTALQGNPYAIPYRSK